MPLSPAEIKHRQSIVNQSNDKGWVSPHHGDGGWHNTPTTKEFSTDWVPMHDKILVALEDGQVKNPFIITPSSALSNSTTRTGTVLKCGPGKWKPGYWWLVKKRVAALIPSSDDKMQAGLFESATIDGGEEWQWFDAERISMTVKPGDRVAIGRYTDFESADSNFGANIVICQEADVRVILPRLQ